VNPAHLEKRARDSICEQCHLEGAVRILNPGKSWRDFHPGEDFEQTAAVYVFGQNGHQVRPVSQVEQLASSKCVLASRGKLWCGSCHKVHDHHTDRSREIRQVCVSCHTVISKVAHPQRESDCVSCHMPRLPTEYAHVAVSDHRIPRRPHAPAERNEVESTTLAAWVDPLAEFRDRDLMLANLIAGNRLAQPALRHVGLTRFESLPQSKRDTDFPALAGACQAMLEENTLVRAVEVCRQAAKREPASADRAMNLGVALKRSGAFEQAEQQLKNAIRLDPSLKHAYVELWTLYDARKQTRKMAETADRFLSWNPQSIMFRVLKQALAEEAGSLLNDPRQ
jgi:hypothetical protein